jgi:hypothetical protein
MTAAPDVLHLLAHRSGLRQRAREDWWGSPIETALAGLSATRHPPAQREQSEQALTGLQRWQRSGAPRPVSADAVALALAASIAAALARSDPELRQAAIEAVEAMARRHQEIVPELHVALAVWALDSVVPDRQARPWPALRDRLARGSVYGFDAALRAYAATVAAPQLDAAALVQSLLTLTPLSPELSDGSTVLWLLAVALDHCTASLPASDSGLRALLDRRTSITGRLAVELDADAFRPPNVPDFDPTEDRATVAGLAPAAYLSSVEALMLDIALAPADDEDAWLTLPQAEALLGRRARDAQRLARAARVQTAMAVEFLAMPLGAALCFGLVLAGSSWRVAITFGLSLTLIVATIGVAIVHRTLGRRPFSSAAGAAFVTGSLCAALNAVNDLLTTPLLSDAAGVITGAAVVSVAAVLWALLAGRDTERAASSAKHNEASPH